LTDTTELHTRPLFDLKTKEGLKFFRGIATDAPDVRKIYCIVLNFRALPQQKLG
jgi:hypothetical protein